MYGTAVHLFLVLSDEVLSFTFYSTVAWLFIFSAPFAWLPVKWCLNLIWGWMIQGYRDGLPKIYGFAANPPTFHYTWYDEIVYCIVVGLFAFATAFCVPCADAFDYDPPLGKSDLSTGKWCLSFWLFYIFANPICFIPCLIARWICKISDINAFYNIFSALIASCVFIPACLLSIYIMYRVIVQVKSFIFQRVACLMLSIPMLIFIGYAKMTFLFGWAGFPRYLMWLMFEK